MNNEPIKTYNQTPSKLRILWETAIRLIGEYENFDKKITSLENKIEELNYKISVTSGQINNV